MALYRDEGLVLRTAKLGEADRIITMLTCNHGRVRAVAKGVRRLKSRFGGRLEPFMRVDLLIATGRSLDVISQASTISPYTDHISADYDVYLAANLVGETADKLFQSLEEPSAAQYRLAVAAVSALSRHLHHPEHIGFSYMLRALALAGWRPRLDACVVCASQENAKLTAFSIASGGVMCSSDRTPDAHTISGDDLNCLRALLAGDWNWLDHRQPSEQHAVVLRIIEEWAEYYLEHPIRSARLLD